MRSQIIRICDQRDTEISANAVTRAMLRGFAGVALEGEKLPVAFVANTAIAAEIVRRWNLIENQTLETK